MTESGSGSTQAVDEPLLSFIHISDTHLSEDPHFNLPEFQHTPRQGALALREAIGEIPIAIDFILHTGDVVHEPNAAAYQEARRFFDDFPFPIYFTAGNHDDPTLLQQHLLEREESQLPFAYEIEKAGVQILVLDSSQTHTHQGKLGTEQLAWLRSHCEAEGERPLVVALHHNPLQAPPSPWWDQMALHDGETFHQILRSARDRLRGVFFGHIHQPLDYHRDGISYFGVGGSWELLHYYPFMAEDLLDRDSLPGFNLVHIGPRTTTIRRHNFRLPLMQDDPDGPDG